MRKKIMIIISIFIFVLGIILAIVLTNNKENRRLEITTIINAKDNYKCEVTIDDENIVKYIKNYSLNEKEDFDDGKSHINFVFEGLKKGRTIVTIKCINTIDDTVLNEENHKVMVNKRLETSIYVLEK